MVDNVIYETVDESKAETIMNTSISAGRGGSFTKKQNLIMNLINSEKSDMWNISESRRQNNARQSAVNEPYVNGLSSNDIDDGNYQPMIPPRRLNKDKEYQSLSPVEEEAGCPQESENTACAVNVTQNRETKSTYQSLIQDGQTGSGSGDYQLLTKSTLRRHTLQFPVS